LDTPSATQNAAKTGAKKATGNTAEHIVGARLMGSVSPQAASRAWLVSRKFAEFLQATVDRYELDVAEPRSLSIASDIYSEPLT